MVEACKHVARPEFNEAVSQKREAIWDTYWARRREVDHGSRRAEWLGLGSHMT